MGESLLTSMFRSGRAFWVTNFCENPNFRMNCMKSTGLNASAIQVKLSASASQRTIFQSVNGKVRAFKIKS